MNNIMKEINESILIGDGAMGTMLQKYGLQAGEIPENWAIKHPDKLLDIHQKYITAGSKLIETNTFGGNRLKLQAGGLESKFMQINSEAVKIARKAAEDKYIAGSVGPTGKMMEPYGQLNFNKAIDVYREQIEILVDSGVDVILIETMSDLQELRAAVIAAEEINIPLIAQMTFSENMHTLTGNTPESFAITVDSLGADIIGVNCTPGITNTLPIIKRMSKVTDKPLSIYPNAGKPVLKDGKTSYPQKPEIFTKNVDELLEFNVRIIGGCCGTKPEHIKKMVKDLNGKLDKKQCNNMLEEEGVFLTGSRKHILISDFNGFKIIEQDNSSTGVKESIKNLTDRGSDLIYLNLDKINIDNMECNLQLPVIIKCEKTKKLKIFLQAYTGKALLLIPENKNEIIKLGSKYGAYIKEIRDLKKMFSNLNKTKKPLAGLINK